MNTNKIIRFLIFPLWGLGGFFFTSCTKEIELDLNSSNSKYVIEAELPQNQVATVAITKTVNFSDSNNFPAIKSADVTITDNLGNTEKLVEAASGVYKTQRIKGEEGKTYTLSIKTEGQTFMANSTMPTAVKLTGLRTAVSIVRVPGSKADTYNIFPQFIDPPALGNNYRFIQVRNNETDKNLILRNDNIGNGEPNARPIFSRDFDVKLGDNVTVEMRCLDKAAYDYFFSLNSVNANGPGGGTTPTNPVTNLSGGALGYFSAYTVQKLSTTVK
jgi:hypothetical protein